MSLLALAYLLLDPPMQRRFLSDPHFKATELLLQERIPKVAAPLQPHAAEVSAARRPPAAGAADHARLPVPHTPIPEVHLLSNGRYHVMVTNAGGGYSRWNDLAVTRWREDATCDGWGSFCYLRDAGHGRALVVGLSTDAAAVEALRSDLRAGPRGVSAAATRTSTRTPRSPFRPKTTSKSAASR